MTPGAASLSLQGTRVVQGLQNIVSHPLPHCHGIIVVTDEYLGKMRREHEAITTGGWAATLDRSFRYCRRIPAGHLGDHKADPDIVVDDPTCRPLLTGRRIVPMGGIGALHHGIKTE